MGEIIPPAKEQVIDDLLHRFETVLQGKARPMQALLLYVASPETYGPLLRDVEAHRVFKLAIPTAKTEMKALLDLSIEKLSEAYQERIQQIEDHLQSDHYDLKLEKIQKTKEKELKYEGGSYDPMWQIEREISKGEFALAYFKQKQEYLEEYKKK
ncbi:MAG: hypothetical protein KC535_02800 [Nanoarchaeota archaeon]|nr:hypothetical protein [Nanoarchaeota archaeon]